MSCVRTFATFRVSSKTHSVKALTEALGIPPTKATDRDVAGKRAIERDLTFWSLSTKPVSDSVNEQEHIDHLLCTLAGLAPLLARLKQEGCLMDVFCYFEIDGQGGPSLTSSQMRALAELDLDISWDIYVSEPQQGASPRAA